MQFLYKRRIKIERYMIGGRRCCGKTPNLIMISVSTGKPIICANETMAKIIKLQAKEMGIDKDLVDLIPIYMLSIMRGDGYRGGYLMDNVEMCLQSLLGVGIDIMTTSIKNVKL